MPPIKILAFAALLTPCAVAAQIAPSPEWPVPAGSRVRIVSPVLGDKRQVGSVHSATFDTLLFRPGAKDVSPIAIATPYITRIEVPNGTHTRKAKGALVGFLVGAGTGAIIGAASYKKPEPCGCIYFMEDSRSFDTALGAVLGGIVGAITGTIIGAGSTESWVPVAVPRR